MHHYYLFLCRCFNLSLAGNCFNELVVFFVLPIWSQLSANVRTAAAADRAQLRDATAAAARPGRLGVDNAAANLEIPRDKIIALNKIKRS